MFIKFNRYISRQTGRHADNAHKIFDHTNCPIQVAPVLFQQRVNRNRASRKEQDSLSGHSSGGAAFSRFLASTHRGALSAHLFCLELWPQTLPLDKYVRMCSGTRVSA